MLDEKYERYWDELDIGDDWREILNSEHDEFKKSVNTYYRRTRSLYRISEKTIYKIGDDKYIQDEIDDEFSEKEKEIIKGVSIQKIRSAIQSLTDTQRLALELYIFRGYKQKKISEIMNSSIQNVSNVISDAFVKITDFLDK